MNLEKRVRDYFFVYCSICGAQAPEGKTSDEACANAKNLAWWKQEASNFTVCLKCRQAIATGL